MMIPVSDVSMGWYDTYSDIIPRITAIRGVIRWWFRALVGGVFYDYGSNETDKTLQLQEKIFGSNEKASLITFKTREWNYEKTAKRETSRVRMLLMTINTLIRIIDRRIYRRIDSQLQKLENSLEGRIKALYEDKYRDEIKRLSKMHGGNIQILKKQVESLKRDMLELLFRNFKLKLEIYSLQIQNEVSFHEKISVLSTLIGIELGSFGKMARRGYGSFIIDYKNTYSELSTIQEIINKCAQKQLDGRIRYLINLAREEISNEFKLNKEVHRDDLPRFPCISKNKINGILVYSLWRKTNTNLEEVQRVFIRSRGRSLADQLRIKGHLAWYLGLPRSQRGTGYMSPRGEEVRRPSPLWVKLRSTNNVIISHFISADWPDALIWRGGFKKRIVINRENLLRAAKIVNEFFANNNYDKIF